MRLLVLGGTVFLGRAVVEAALARGDEVTLFTRGETNPELFPEAERLRGDREGDLSVLEGREWDAVVDTSGYLPRVVGASAQLLAPSVGHYVFVSSISVYAPGMPPGFDESAPLVELEDPTEEEIRGDTYGGLKVLCERAVEEAFGAERCTQVRAAVIVGPHDPTGRFTYWAHRLARGGEVLLPGPPERPLQVVDVRDAAEWMLRAASERTSGAFTVAHPPWRFSELVETARADGLGEPEPVWVEEAFLLEQGVGPWMELPLWIPSASDAGHMLEADPSRAAAAGLRFRPLEESLRGALEEAELKDGVGLAPERERELLRLWRERSG